MKNQDFSFLFSNRASRYKKAFSIRQNTIKETKLPSFLYIHKKEHIYTHISAHIYTRIYVYREFWFGWLFGCKGLFHAC